MTKTDHNKFFEEATGNPPFDYQRLWLVDRGTDCRSQLINIPTGLGKTAAVVLAWLWNRVELEKADWPRRLVYCLPMRTLVEQTQSNVHGWARKSSTIGNGTRSIPTKIELDCHISMGGEDRGEKNPWIFIQKRMRSSLAPKTCFFRCAPNRGDGTNRYRWPMHFGLLNNDCPGRWTIHNSWASAWKPATTDGFRHMGTMPTFGACPTWWMSATLMTPA